MELKLTLHYADEAAAYITDAAGFDVAVVRRLTPIDVCEKEQQAHCLSDEQWDAFVGTLAESINRR
jgi:hypothetical protein